MLLDFSAYLNRGQVLLRELRNRSINPLINQTLAHLTIRQATLDLSPILGAIDPLLQPMRVIPEVVLLIPFPGHHFPGALVGDHESEDGEEEEDEDEEEHDDEVDP